MAFIKLGDEQPILSTYDSNGEQLVCSVCHQPIVMINIDDEIKPVCRCAFLDEQEKQNVRK